MAFTSMGRHNSDVQNGIDAENYYYNQSQGYMNPYTEYSNEDFSNGRNALYGFGKQRMGQAPGFNQDYFGLTLGKTPEDILNEAMSGYTESPLAQQQMQQSLSASDNAMASEGMYGSGDNSLQDAEIGNKISTEDMNNYLQAKGKAYGLQGNALDKYNKQSQELISLFRDMLQTEFKGSSKMADIAQKVGMNEGNEYSRAAAGEARYQPLNQLASLGGLGYGMLKGSGSGDSSGGINWAKMGKDAGMAAMFM